MSQQYDINQYQTKFLEKHRASCRLLCHAFSYDITVIERPRNIKTLVKGTASNNVNPFDDFNDTLIDVM